MRQSKDIAGFGSILALAGLLSVATLVTEPASGQPGTPGWASTGNLNTRRYRHTATLLPNGKVLVAGGGEPGCFASTSAELYEPVSGTWSHTGSLNTARLGHTATLLQNGQVLVAGGHAAEVSFNKAELYDSATGTWRLIDSFSTIRTKASATLLPNGEVLAVGASGAELTGISAELYDPVTETWRTTGAPSFVPGRGNTVLLPNDKVLAVFESTPWDYDDVSTELYDPATGEWSPAGRLPLWWVSSVTLLRNGKVLVTGLYGANYPTRAAIYDSDTGTWSITGDLGTFRHYGGYSATLLANGQVLVAGGTDYISNEPVSAEESYDPITGTWRLISRLTADRQSHTATLLGDGKVLIAGGLSIENWGLCGANIRSSAELYDPGTFRTKNRRRSVRP